MSRNICRLRQDATRTHFVVFQSGISESLSVTAGRVATPCRGVPDSAMSPAGRTRCRGLSRCAPTLVAREEARDGPLAAHVRGERVVLRYGAKSSLGRRGWNATYCHTLEQAGC